MDDSDDDEEEVGGDEDDDVGNLDDYIVWHLIIFVTFDYIGWHLLRGKAGHRVEPFQSDLLSDDDRIGHDYNGDNDYIGSGMDGQAKSKWPDISASASNTTI